MSVFYRATALVREQRRVRRELARSRRVTEALVAELRQARAVETNGSPALIEVPTPPEMLGGFLQNGDA